MRFFLRIFAHMGYYCEFKKHWYVNFWPWSLYPFARSIHVTGPGLNMVTCEVHETEFLREHNLEALLRRLV